MIQRNTSTLKKDPRNKGKHRWGLLSLIAIIGFILSLGIIYSQSKMDENNPLSFYFNLANPYERYVVINPGMRMEEIADKIAKAVNWTDKEKQAFLDSAPKDDNGPMEGFFMPGSYWINVNATGKEVAQQILDNFNKEVGDKVLAKKKTKTSAQKINLETAVRIASIIQREAAGPRDMNLISGVIWNRLFKGMNLGIDATLQYAKGNERNWWPRVLSSDKKIDSPYNTYSNIGLPPTAISNISIEALKAAYAPQKTDCMYYLHDNNRQIHCSKTYEQHKNNIQTYLVGTRGGNGTAN
ncbi:MAG: endolytic transglycosylase MltG [bacterium]